MISTALQLLKTLISARLFKVFEKLMSTFEDVRIIDVLLSSKIEIYFNLAFSAGKPLL